MKVPSKQPPGPGGVLLFAVIRGRADFQGRLFDPKYFRRCKFEFQLSAGPKKYFRPGRKLGFGHKLLRKNSFEQGDFFYLLANIP